jgi:short-subunit dehydrogenase
LWNAPHDSGQAFADNRKLTPGKRVRSRGEFTARQLARDRASITGKFLVELLRVGWPTALAKAAERLNECRANYMKNLDGKTAILTGASGGLGKYLAEGLATAGVNLILVAYPGADLEMVRKTVTDKGRKAISLPLDLRDPAQREQLLAETRKQFGAVDLLINNAGVELSSVYHELPQSTLRDILSVNLEAPMMLAWAILPEMVRRGAGHIVNVSSLAGKSGPGWQEPYAATKAGLVGFTFSLRATYAGTGVSASVICPGFVEAGIYSRIKERTGCVAPVLLGSSSPERVVSAVMRAIKNDLPEVIVNPYPVRPLFALTALFPRVGEWILTRLGAHEFFRRVAEAEKRSGVASQK